MIYKPSLFKHDNTNGRKALGSAVSRTKTISSIDIDTINKAKNSSKHSTKNDSNTKLSSISLFKVSKDTGPRTINHGIGKNSIAFLDRAILKKGFRQASINPTDTYQPQYRSLLKSTSSRNHNQSVRNQPTLKIQRQEVSLSKLMNTQLTDILPPRIKYANPHPSSRNIKSRLPELEGQSSSESFAKRFQTMKVSLKNPIKSEPFLKKLLGINNETTKHLRLLCKLKLMKWLWRKKSFLVEKMLYSFDHCKWFFDKYNQLDKKTFKELMLLIELGRDDEFVDQLFLIFGQNKAQTIKIKECLFFFVFTSSSPYERKLQMHLELVEDESALNVVWVYRLLNSFNAIMSKRDFYLCKNILRRITKEETMYKKELYAKLKDNAAMRSLFDSYAATLANINSKLNEEFDIILSSHIGDLLNINPMRNMRSYSSADYKRLENLIDLRLKTKETKDRLENLSKEEDAIE